MDEKTITELEKKQAYIVGEVNNLKKDYSGHYPLVSQLENIECCAETTLNYLKKEREELK